MSFYVLGNWKSNGTSAMVAEFASFFQNFDPPTPPSFFRGLSLPFHLLGRTEPFHHALIGAQNLSRYPEGAYTGEITANMVKSTGCRFVLVGHSERRQYFGESVEDTAAKLDLALKAELLPVLCIGETLAERRAGALERILAEQLTPLGWLPGGTELVVAYEPVWAIGTGVAARPEDVVQAQEKIKDMLTRAGFPNTAVLYGGSVKPANAASLGAIPSVDGFLVGGASLVPQDFKGIIEGFLQAKI